jgi:hypothetical protein
MQITKEPVNEIDKAIRLLEVFLQKVEFIEPPERKKIINFIDAFVFPRFSEDKWEKENETR